MSTATITPEAAAPAPGTSPDPSASAPRVLSALAARWQIPLSIVSVGVLATGLLHIASSYHPLSLDEQLLLASQLRAAGRISDAAGYLKDLIEQPVIRPDTHRAELHMALAVTIHEAESKLKRHGTSNVEAIVSNFERARRLGRSMSADDCVMAADAYSWTERYDEAVTALNRAIELGNSHPSLLRQRIADLRMSDSGECTEQSLAELDKIIEDPKAETSAFVWALEHKAEWLFEQGRFADATGLVASARKRADGEGFSDLLTYLEACGLAERGDAEDAARSFEAIRSRRETRDELWAKSGLHLGMLELRDERPQSALSYFEDVLRSYERGEIHDQCDFGRAQGLALLERHTEALETFGRLGATIRASRKHSPLSSKMVRTALTVAGQSLTDRPGATEADVISGIAYLRLALDWFAPSERIAQLPHLERIANGLAGLAKSAESKHSGDASAAPRLHDEAGEAYVRLARLQNEDDTASSQSMWRAVEEYGLAGRRDRVIALLERFVQERPSSSLRSRAMHQLGQAYQADGRFAEATKVYQQVIDEFLPLPNALASMVPLAQCLIQQGGDFAPHGVKILVDIVDDKGPQPLFTPQAAEYRQALFLLARYYLRADDRITSQHLERAIERLDDAKALYPDDPQTPELTFHLGDSYRLSALALARGENAATSAPDTDERRAPEISSVTRAESDRRMTAALRNYADVIAALAPQDESKLTDIERAFLKLSYLYRGDCLFDLQRYQEALAAYEETAWRYANGPACVSASMQIYHCHLRLGHTDEARATLGRLKWLIATIPAEAFDRERGMPGKQYWEDMIIRLERLGDAVAQQ